MEIDSPSETSVTTYKADIGIQGVEIFQGVVVKQRGNIFSECKEKRKKLMCARLCKMRSTLKTKGHKLGVILRTNILMNRSL